MTLFRYYLRAPKALCGSVQSRRGRGTGLRLVRLHVIQMETVVKSSPIGTALEALAPDALYVIVSYYWGRVSERQIAKELTELRECEYSRDTVHRIRLTAEARLSRHLARWKVTA